MLTNHVEKSLCYFLPNVYKLKNNLKLGVFRKGKFIFRTKDRQQATCTNCKSTSDLQLPLMLIQLIHFNPFQFSFLLPFEMNEHIYNSSISFINHFLHFRRSTIQWQVPKIKHYCRCFYFKTMAMKTLKATDK